MVDDLIVLGSLCPGCGGPMKWSDIVGTKVCAVCRKETREPDSRVYVSVPKDEYEATLLRLELAEAWAVTAESLVDAIASGDSRTTAVAARRAHEAKARWVKAGGNGNGD